MDGALAAHPGADVGASEAAGEAGTPDASGPDLPAPVKRVDGKTLGPCQPPAGLGGDTLVLLGQNDPWNDPAGGSRTHLEDVEIDPSTGLVYATGQGGTMIFKDTGGEPDLVVTAKQKFNRVEVLPGKYLAVSNRDYGFRLFDISTPGTLGQAAQVALPGASGMASSGEGLYVLATGVLHVYDTSKTPPAELTTLLGLGNPWEMAVSGSRGYIADNTLGLVPVDLANPEQPVLGTPVATAGSAQDLTVYGDVLYVAAGSAGIQAFSIADPTTPVALSVVPTGSTVIGVAAADGWLWATNQAEVLVFDLSDPATPKPVGSQATQEFAMAPAALGTRAFVAAWGFMELYEVKPDASVPEVDPSKSTVYFVGDATSASFALANQGQGTLTVSGLDLPDPRFGIWLDKTDALAGETITVWVDLVAPDGLPIDTTLCVATNDPDETLLEIAVKSSSSGSDVALGEPAPDFTLPDLDGVSHQLSARKGNPVVLLFFATW